MDHRAVDEDPFVDPVHPHPHSEERQRPVEDSTLIAGRTASLTLGTDSLIVLGMDNDLGDRTSTANRTIGQTRDSHRGRDGTAVAC